MKVHPATSNFTPDPVVYKSVEFQEPTIIDGLPAYPVTVTRAAGTGITDHIKELNLYYYPGGTTTGIPLNENWHTADVIAADLDGDKVHWSVAEEDGEPVVVKNLIRTKNIRISMQQPEWRY